MKTAIVTGASSGLGKLIAEELDRNGYGIINWSLDQGVDVRSIPSVAYAASQIDGPIDVLVNCAGINGINFLQDVSEQEFDQIMDTNAKSIYVTAKILAERLRNGTILTIVSNAAHVPMTSSLAYNASKGAALIMSKQLARELKKSHNVTCFSVSPNKLSGTGMSNYIDQRVCELRGWTPEEARAYQLAALPAGDETPPEVLAEFIGFLLSKKERHFYLAGCDITYGGP